MSEGQEGEIAAATPGDTAPQGMQEPIKALYRRAVHSY